MQVGLLPEKLPQIEGWEIAARSIVATEAGGDLYDFLQDEEGRLWIAAGAVDERCVPEDGRVGHGDVPTLS